MHEDTKRTPPWVAKSDTLHSRPARKHSLSGRDILASETLALDSFGIAQ